MYKIYLTILFALSACFASSQTVDFTFTNTTGIPFLCSPASINFTPVCTGNPIGFTWYFGNGDISNSSIPSRTFTAGTYSVKLVAVFQNQALEVVKTIVVNPDITASIASNKIYVCKPDTILFTSTTNATNPSFLYDFADGTLPVTSNSDTISHYFANFGTYNVKVVVTSAGGCSDSSIVTVDVKKFNITASVSPDVGCAPITANFSCNAAIPATSTVASYAWNFGDGTATSITSAGNTPHTYVDSGIYLPTILITTAEGCTNTFNFPAITFGKPPTILTAYPKNPVYCASDFAEFVATANFANEYKWNFGDGSIVFTSDTLVQHQYASLGVKTVTVTPIYNGCAGTPLSFTVNIIGVIALFDYANTCSNKKTFRFNNFSLGTSISSTWDFGDASALINTTNAVHTFPQVGTFNTKLKVVDNISGCVDSIQYPIFTANPVLVNPDSFLCKNANTTFSVLNNYSNPSVGYSWNVIGLVNNANGSNTISASLLGTFATHTVVLNNGLQYCPDTIRLNKVIAVRGPSLGFSTNASPCTNNNFIITNTSFPFAALDTIKRWHWTFGIPNLTDTNYQPTPFVFGAEGNYTIKLVAKDKNGCIDSLDKQILVKESPFLRIFPRNQTICAGSTVTLTGYHTDTLVWVPANLVSCATCDTTIATPVASTKIYAIASNAAGCSLRDSSIITVFTPFVATADTKTFFACKNDTVRITGIQPTDKRIVWTPNIALNNNTVYKPLVKPLADTVYTAQLTDSIGCYSSSVDVAVKLNPPASVNAGADRVLAYGSPFTISPKYSPDVDSYTWSPRGNLNCVDCANPTGIAELSQTFVIKASNRFKCTSKDTISIFIECAYANLFMANAFVPNNNGIGKYYYPQTRGIKKINLFSIYNRSGQLLYSVRNALPNQRNLGWNGKYNGLTQTLGGYVYLLEATCDLGEIVTKKGSFLVLR